ncbi:DUF4362 domain-containing protein [Saccharibacillus sacchari]|uniref:DUF4362 domain-containing protein n=1 Tax=Saccharibacillus sacchari TaxID=456493 RepID=A0ACC6PEA4_9BACL
MPKKTIPLLLLISLFFLTSCAGAENETFAVNEKENAAQPVVSTVQQPQPADTEVLISRNFGFGRINPSLYLKLEGEKHVEAFQEADRTKHQLMGMMDVRHPDFDVVFNSGGQTRQLHLWMPKTSEERAMVTEIDNTGTGYLLTPASTKVLRDLIGDYRYDSVQAVKNGDVVQTIGKIENFDAWEDFLEAVEQSRPASVQKVGYTIEGDPIFDNLHFDGQTIQYVYDDTLDRFGSHSKEFETCEKVLIEPIPAELHMSGEVYRLSGCSITEGGLNKNFWFAIPDEGVEIIGRND